MLTVDTDRFKEIPREEDELTELPEPDEIELRKLQRKRRAIELWAERKRYRENAQTLRFIEFADLSKQVMSRSRALRDLALSLRDDLKEEVTRGNKETIVEETSHELG